MAFAEMMYAALGTASFSVDAATAKTLNSTAASGSNLTALKSSLGNRSVTKALISCPGGNIRWSAGGATPTATTYHRLLAGNVLVLDIDPLSFSFISESGTVTVYVDYYGE